MRLRPTTWKPSLHPASILLPLFLLGLFHGHAQNGDASDIRFRRFSDRQGLSANSIFTITQDRHGFLWIGTIHGLNRFDGYRFRKYKHDPEDITSISDNNINCLLTDRAGRMWLGTNNGLDLYQPEKDNFRRIPLPIKGAGSPGSKRILTLFEDREGQIWMGCRSGGCWRYNLQSETFENYNLEANGLNNNTVSSVAQDSDGRIWVGTLKGLNLLDPQSHRFTPYSLPGYEANYVWSIFNDNRDRLWIAGHSGLIRYNKAEDRLDHLTGPNFPAELNQTIQRIGEDRLGRLWLGSRSGGLIRYDAATNTALSWRHEPSNVDSLSHNGITAIFEDDTGQIWIGTDSGLNQYDPRTEVFGLRKNLLTNSLNNSDVRAICEDNKGRIWLGTYGAGLLKIAAKTGEITTYQQNQSPTLSNNIVWSLYEDSKGRIWAGHEKGIDLYQEKQDSFRHVTRWKEERETNPRNATYAMLEDQSGHLWMATGGGLKRLNPATYNFSSYQHDPSIPDSLSHNDVWCLAFDKENHLWVGTGGGGLNRLDQRRERFDHFRASPNQSGSLSHNSVLSLCQDSSGRLWVGTSLGLNLYRGEGRGFTVYGERDGLPNPTICGIQEDYQGSLWLSTKKGLVRFEPETETFSSFEFDDGLQANDFNEGAWCRGKGGRLYFGGTEGINSFLPIQVTLDRSPPNILLTDLLLYNKPVPVLPDTPGAILSSPLHETSTLRLASHQKMISFEFAAIHFAAPMRNQYSYRLAGHDPDWIQTGADRRFATYTNLKPGTYHFHVKGANKDSYWNQSGSKVALIVVPEWWRAAPAKIVYLLLTVFIAVFLVIRTRRLRMSREASITQALIGAKRELDMAERERLVVEALRQIDRHRDEFLASISSELRTPLNGIIGLAETLMENRSEIMSETARTHLTLIISSGKRLTSLVDDIHDYAQLRRQNMNLEKRAVNLYSLVDVVLSLLRPVIQTKHLELINAVNPTATPVDADEDRLIQILNGLVSNAVKFTREGSVRISSKIKGDMMVVSVTDTGIGIPQQELKLIIASFSRGDHDGGNSPGGTGLGLAVTNQLINLHGGQLKATSEPGKGTCFTFTLPLAQSDQESPVAPVAGHGNTLSRIFNRGGTQSKPEVVQPHHQTRRWHILLVDDEPVNRRILIQYLDPNLYRVTEAKDGPSALKILENDHFDLVLLDVMMPRMSGLDVCRKIREKHTIQSLPILFLTARNQIHDLTEGFESGSNDYLTKPIGKVELLTRLQTHLRLLCVYRNLEAAVFDHNRKLREKTEEVLNAQKQLAMQEKASSLGLLTAGVSHEINNPTSFALVGAQNLEVDLGRFRHYLIDLVEEDADPGIVQAFNSKLDHLNEHVAIILEGTQRIRQIVRDLHTFARAEVGNIETVSLTDSLKATINLVRAQYKETIEFVSVFEDPLTLKCRAAELNQVFLNLVINACHAMESEATQEHQGKLTIFTTAEKEWAVIRFQDTGKGIPLHLMDRIFEPFFTTKSAGVGTGMGLSISYGIIQKIGGRMEVDSEEGKGSTFSIYLPWEPKQDTSDPEPS